METSGTAGTMKEADEAGISETVAQYTLARLADAAGIDYLYNGQYGVMTDGNGLYYMRARYYNQDIKRFINRDVVSGSITDSQSLNRYCYVQGNPVSLTDPFGLCPDPNSNFKNFCKVFYYTDWNAVGHAALDVVGIFWDGADVVNALWYACEGNTKEAVICGINALPGIGMCIGSLMEKTDRLKNAGRTVRYLSRMAQGGMGTAAGIEMTKAGFTNILNGLESGDLSAVDVGSFLGGLAVTALSGKHMVSSGRELLDIFDDAAKVSKAAKGKTAGNESVSNTFGDYSTKIDSKVTVIEKQELPDWLVDTYKDGVYRTVVTNENITVYRSFGYNADAGGSFATSSPALSRVQTKVDSAILPEWKNSLRYEAEIVIPKGTILNIGRVGEQYTMSGTRLAGDADQFLLPQNWDLNWIKSIRVVRP